MLYICFLAREKGKCCVKYPGKYIEINFRNENSNFNKQKPGYFTQHDFQSYHGGGCCC